MAIDYKSLRWDDLIRQAQTDHSQQWNVKDAFDPYSGGMTNIGGRGAQIYVPELNWGNASFNLNNPEDPNQPQKHMTRLTRGDDGGVNVDYYEMNRGFPVGAAMVLAAPFAASGLQSLFGGGFGAAAPAWTSGYDLAMGADLMGMTGAGAAGAAGAGAGMASGAGSAAGTAASGAGEAAGWTSGFDLPMGTTGGNGMLDTLLSKGLDFATSKAGSALIGGLLGGAGSSGPSSSTTTNRVELDPRMAGILYGDGANPGVINRITGLLDDPQNPGMSKFGAGMDAYLGDYGRGEFDNNMRSAAQMRDVRAVAPLTTAASMQAARINAPEQNDINLAPAYNDMIYGAPGANPYLEGAIQKGINQGRNAFTDTLTDATRRITQDVLPSIRSGAVVNGMMGSSRQGIAEGRALEDLNTQVTRAAERFGQGATDTAVAARAGAYDTDQNRRLAAMSGLSGNQFGVATTQAGLDQDANKTNAGFQQQTNLANQGTQMQSNIFDFDRQKAGVGLSSGMLGSAYGYGGDADSYAGDKVGQVAGLLSPFTGLGSTQTSTQPIYRNTGASILGGALMGQQLAKGFGFGNSAPSWTSGFDLF